VTDETRSGVLAGPIAFAPRPLVGEPLDGWIEFIAAGLGSDRSDVVAALGLPPIKAAYTLVRDTTPEQLQQVSDITDVPVDVLAEMTLSRWESLGLKPSIGKRGHGGGPWARGSGARYCPACLTERGLRWSLKWFVQWTFACERHAVWLHGACPRCGTVPRTNRHGHPVHHGEPDCAQGCSVETLASASLLPIDSDHPALATQRLLTTILDSPEQQMQSLGRLVPAAVYLRDVGGLTRAFIKTLAEPDLRAAATVVLGKRLSPDWSDHLARIRLGDPNSMSLKLRDGVTYPAMVGLAATVAVGTLAHDTVDAAAESLSWLPASGGRFVARVQRRSGMSLPLLRALNRDAHRVGFLYKARLAGVLGDSGVWEIRPPLDPAKVPGRFWPSAAASLNLSRADEFALASLSAMILCAGRSRPVQDAAEPLGLSHLQMRLRHDWHQILHAEQGDVILNDLLELHTQLIRSALPIDYNRRRKVFPAPVEFSYKKVRRVARDIDTRITPRLARFTSWFVFELLTGTDVLLTPNLLDLPGGHRHAYRVRREDWSASTPSSLLLLAEAELLRHKINEPIAWAPEKVGEIWTIPVGDLSRTLPGWSSRALRVGPSRLPQTLPADTLPEIVAFAASGQSASSAAVARRLNLFRGVGETSSLRETAGQKARASSYVAVQMAELQADVGEAIFDHVGPRGQVRITERGHELIELVVAAESAGANFHQLKGRSYGRGAFVSYRLDLRADLTEPNPS
jgi:hypothetical protein